MLHRIKCHFARVHCTVCAQRTCIVDVRVQLCIELYAYRVYINACVCVREKKDERSRGGECTQMLARPIITYDYIITGGNKFNFLHCIRYTDSTYDRRLRIGICDAPLLLYFVSHNFDATRVLKHVQAFECHVSPAPLSLLPFFPMPSHCNGNVLIL